LKVLFANKKHNLRIKNDQAEAITQPTIEFSIKVKKFRVVCFENVSVEKLGNLETAAVINRCIIY